MPKRLCEIIRSHIRRFALQIISSDVRCPPILRAQKYVSVGSLGRSSFAGGGSLFPPCLLAFSPSGEQSPTLCQHTRRPHSSECANARRNVSGLRFPTSYSVVGCKPLTIHAMGLRRAPALSLSPGFVFLCGHTRPATQSTQARRAEKLPLRVSRVFPLAAGAHPAGWDIHRRS